MHTDSSVDSLISKTHDSVLDAAAMTIQKVWRGYRVRLSDYHRKVASGDGRLSYPLYSLAKEYIDHPEKQLASERNSEKIGGNSQVDFPKHIPGVIIKHAGENAKIRLETMEIFRSFLLREMPHSRSHLVIPQVRLYEKNLIEERLPCCGKYGNRIAQTRLYLDHHEEFTAAIRELTYLFCRVFIRDVACILPETIPSNIAGKEARYDNIPFLVYKESGVQQYNLGLIDLEEWDILPPGENYRKIVERQLMQLVILYPLHLNVILEEAVKYDKELNLSKEDLENAQNIGLKNLKSMYSDPHAFFERKDINLKNPDRIVELSQERQEQIVQRMTESLRDSNQYSAQLIDLCEREGFIKQTVERIPGFIKKMILKKKKPSCSTIEELIQSRTFLLNSQEFKFPANFPTWDGLWDLEEVYQLYEDSKDEDQFDSEISSLATAIGSLAFAELLKGDEICYFDKGKFRGFVLIC
jgi:hypothetical protein